ncbi:hypothetical protein, partial [Bergeyella sp. RCAD1439]|uniref:hypothetical protein n=1 Tax=Bergeyella anatis TaxID=3113737 RepID=UPI002E197FB5|nr:hypothetical protein [Bergeyella sp. RCAD1439]
GNADSGSATAWIQISDNNLGLDVGNVYYESRSPVNANHISTNIGSNIFIYLKAGVDYYIKQRTIHTQRVYSGERKFFLYFVQ